MNYIVVHKNWQNFKQEINRRGLTPKYYTHIKGDPTNNEYRIYALDEYFMLECWLSKDGSLDVEDFDNNYKNIWDGY
jgi:hypothetical protein